MQERSTVLEEFAHEHSWFCGNNSEPDPYNILPRLEGRSLLVNLWAYVDPSMEVGFATLANRFYTATSKDDYRNGYSPASFSNNIYSQRYRELYSYSQVSYFYFYFYVASSSYQVVCLKGIDLCLKMTYPSVDGPSAHTK